MKIKSLFFLLIYISFPLFFSSCDKVLSAFKEEFDSEKLKKKQLHPLALSQISAPKDPILYLKYSDVFILTSESFTINPVMDRLNTYKIEIKTSPAILKFGGKEKILLKTINNYVFLNRWAEGAFNLGAIVLYDQSDSIDSKSYLNVFLFSPELNIDTNTFSFLFKPEGPMQLSFLEGTLRNCMLLIYSEEENF
jgi:hypothetical protein